MTYWSISAVSKMDYNQQNNAVLLKMPFVYVWELHFHSKNTWFESWAAVSNLWQVCSPTLLQLTPSLLMSTWLYTVEYMLCNNVIKVGSFPEKLRAHW